MIDGQQRIYSVYRFIDNQFKLNGLEVLSELNDLHYYQMQPRIRRRLDTYTLRCVIVTNDSDPEIKFDVFERLNTNTVPLTAQEIRNCIYRGPLNDLLVELAEDPVWLNILNRKEPEKRMRGEELILRFFAFYLNGVESYRTPQKFWLNDVAKAGRKFTEKQIDKLRQVWQQTLQKSLLIFDSEICFRRLPLQRRSVINRALMELTMLSLTAISLDKVENVADEYRQRYINLLADPEFDELITRAIDHKSRTIRRFELWSKHITHELI